MRLQEIEKRLSAIKGEIDKEGVDLDALEKEIEALKEERKALLEKIEKRKALLNGVASLENPTIIKTFEEEKEVRKMEFNKDNVLGAAEYRSAWLNSIRGQELNETEKRALTTAVGSVGNAVPTITVNKVIEKVKQYAPMLNKIELLGIKGNVSIPAEGTTIEAQLHAEGAVINSDDDTLNKVNLSGFEVTKLVTISKSVETMSIDAFENWITTKIAKKVAEKINALIINGTGSNQAQGINAITWNAANSITVAKAASLTEMNVTNVVALLGGGYLDGAEWLMSSATFFADFYPLMNNSKNNVVTESNGIYRVMGKIVTFDDRVNLHEAVLGNVYEGYVGNLQEDVTITSQFVTRENAYDFLGCAIFDGKVKAVEAFVKIVKATV